ncbi:MAG: T9SS type A sorting domain-containing protein [Taibaiella sp.]|nr:T9SS type A sorting domain-containing protein [Taibaiella sp.]
MQKFFLLLISVFMIADIQAKEIPQALQTGGKKGFVENIGQIIDQFGKTRKDIDFKLETPELCAFVGSGALHYQWFRYPEIDRSLTRYGGPAAMEQLKNVTYSTYRLDVKLVNANPDAEVIKEEVLPYFQRYHLSHLGLTGTKAQAYSKLTYKNIYPNIDWVIYIAKGEQQGQMKYDFVVHPGGNPALIKLAYEGASHLHINEDGSFTATTPFGKHTDGAPYSYIKTEQGQGAVINTPYQLTGNILSFDIAPVNGTLVIDPTVEWSTYYGGAGFDLAANMKCDYAGNVYVTGSTFLSTNMATTGAHQVTNAGDFDAYLAKFDAQGALLWATYYGGEGMDYSFGLASDRNNKMYISGVTRSLTGIATVGGPQTVQSGGDIDFFLSRFDKDGNLLWGRYFGTSGEEYGGICAANDFGQVHLAGYSKGNNLIALNAHQANNSSTEFDAVLAQFDTLGNQMWGTFYGGDSIETSDGLAYDKMGNVYLAGVTNSLDSIATPGAFQPALAGGFDYYLVKFDTLGQRVWGTYYGGTNAESVVTPILVFNQNNVLSAAMGNELFMVGVSYSDSGIATAGTHQDTLNGDADAFLVKFDSQGNRIWATYYGGTGFDQSGAVVSDFAGNAYWAGFTESFSGLETPGAYQTANNGWHDAYLAKFDANGQLLYGTFFGGSGDDEALAVSIDNQGNTYISGGTMSPGNVATPGAYLTTYGGGVASFITKFCTANLLGGITGPDTACARTPITLTTPVVPGATDYIWILPQGWQGASNTNTIEVIPNGQSDTVWLKIVKCDTSTAIWKSIYIHENPEAIIVANGAQLSTQHQHQTYQWYYNQQPLSGATNSSYTATQLGYYQVVVTNEGSCTDTSELFNYNGVGIGETERLKAAIRLYPNPTEGKLFINSPVKINIQLYSMEGRSVLAAKNVHMIDLAEWSNGVYLLKIFDQHNRFIKAERITLNK